MPEVKAALYVVFAALTAWCAGTIYFTSGSGDGWLALAIFLIFSAVIFLTFCGRNGASFRQPLPNSIVDRVWRIGVRILCGVLALPAFTYFLGGMGIFGDGDFDSVVVLLPFALYGGFVTGMLIYLAVAGLRPIRIAPA